MWILLLIAAILILKSLMTSHKASGVATRTVYVSQSCGSSGDNFHTGCTMVAGVSQPDTPLLGAAPSIHCCHIVAHFPVNPPPIAIQQPVKPIAVPKPITAAPMPGPAQRLPVSPVRPIFPVSTRIPVRYANYVSSCGMRPNTAYLDQLAGNAGQYMFDPGSNCTPNF